MTYTRRTFLKTAGIAAVLAAFGGITFINQAKVGAGGKDILKQKVLNSPHYINGEFKNFEQINEWVSILNTQRSAYADNPDECEHCPVDYLLCHGMCSLVLFELINRKDNEKLCVR